MIPIEILNDTYKRDLFACEVFLRRAALLNYPFMLKGSLVTRQYFDNPKERDVADMDWVYLEKIESPEQADEIFSDWMTKITTMDFEDAVCFQDFRENRFWRMIDYAMADDFPTVNTDIDYTLNGGGIFGISNIFRSDVTDCLCVDISFNLDMDIKPIPLLYHPLCGEPFTIPYTPPLSLQVAWKLHQTVVRPRLKDLKDLHLLLQHKSYDETALQQTLEALMKEWKRDNYINPLQMENLFFGNIHDIDRFFSKYDYSPSERNEFKIFIRQFVAVMRQAGINKITYREKFLPLKETI